MSKKSERIAIIGAGDACKRFIKTIQSSKELSSQYSVVYIFDDNFLLYAMKFYENPQCLSESDFNNDLKILKYVKRLLNRYERTQVLKERLMLNHLIMLGNVFPVKVLVRILFLKIPVQYWSELKTFLIFLNYMPEKIESINGRSIISSDIQINLDIANKLREI